MATRILVSLAFTSSHVTKLLTTKVAPALLARFCQDTTNCQMDLVTMAVLCRVPKVRKLLVRTPRALETVVAIAWRYMTAEPSDVVNHRELVAAGTAALRILHHMTYDESLHPVLVERGLVRVLCVLLCGLVRRHVALRKELQGDDAEGHVRSLHTSVVVHDADSSSNGHSLDSTLNDSDISFAGRDPNVSVVLLSDDDVEESDDDGQLLDSSLNASFGRFALLPRPETPRDSESPIPTRNSEPDVHRRMSRLGGGRDPETMMAQEAMDGDTDLDGDASHDIEGRVMVPDVVGQLMADGWADAVCCLLFAVVTVVACVTFVIVFMVPLAL
jgi:hypothetical protein